MKIKQMIMEVKKKGTDIANKKINPVWAVLSILCLLVVIGGIIWFVSSTVKKEAEQKAYEDLSNSMQQLIVEEESQTAEPSAQPEKEEKSTPLPTETPKVIVDPYEKNVDFENLQQKINDDIYAWIYIPGTMVDYPIVQHDSDNTYYLNHNLNGSSGYPGCIFTENYNSKDMSNLNTVIYGHNMKNGTMFADVRKFMEADFVKEHPYVYIYMADKMYVYQIYAVYESGNEHLLAGKDFSSSRVWGEYIDATKSAAADNGFLDKSVSVTEDSKIITLSTCVTGQNEKRVLLQAVLTE